MSQVVMWIKMCISDLELHGKRAGRNEMINLVQKQGRQKFKLQGAMRQLVKVAQN